MGLNGGLGMVKKDGRFYYTTGDEVGMYGNAEERYQGTLLRKLMERRHMLAVKTFSDLPPTYHGWDGSTLHIDQILLPKGVMRKVYSTRVLEAKGRRPQLTKDQNLRGHVPLCCCIDVGHNCPAGGGVCEMGLRQACKRIGTR